MDFKKNTDNKAKEKNKSIIDNNISENDSIIQYKSIKYHYKNPPLIGLINLGYTDYMNVVLQCFSNIEQLTNYFKYDSYIKQIIKNKPNSFIASYKLIIDKLWPSNNNHNILFDKNISFSPNDFSDQIYSSLNPPLFGRDQANDAFDLFYSLILEFHEELNRPNNNNNNNLGNLIDTKNEQLVFDYYSKKFKNENNSIIIDLFNIMEKEIITCTNCKIPSINFHYNYYTIFPLEVLKNCKLKELENNNKINQKEKEFKISLLNKNIINIKDCFEQYQRIAINSLKSLICLNCNKKTDADYQILFHILPQIFIFNLNRGRNFYKGKLIFDEILDLKDYGKNGGIYELINVITYLGKDNSNGHFIAACKSFIDNRWYRYNDAVVSEITNFEKDIVDFGLPYILFYKRKNNN